MALIQMNFQRKNHEELEKINNKLEMMDSCIYKLENIRFAIKDKVC